MRILLITETVPFPPDTGGRIKTWHTLEALAREHEVHCHAFARTEAQRDVALRALSRVCASATLHLVPRSLTGEMWHAARSLWWELPLTVVRQFSTPAMARIASDCRERRIDVLYCDHLSMLEYGRRLALPIVHDAHNVEHRVVRRYADGLPKVHPKRLLLEREATLLARYERACIGTCALVFAVSEVDAAFIAASAPGVPVVPVPIAVAASRVPQGTILDAPEVLFIGAQDWPPNADAVRYFLSEVWPGILARVPDARLTVVGRGRPSIPAPWRGHPSVRLTGWVPDVEPWFQQTRVLVVPLRSGSGMRVKILDAFARGTPVVTTSIGIEGIEARHGHHALIADAPESFVEATVGILRSRPLAQRLADAARALALERYDTAPVAELQLATLRRLSVGAARSRGDRVTTSA